MLTLCKLCDTEDSMDETPQGSGSHGRKLSCFPPRLYNKAVPVACQEACTLQSTRSGPFSSTEFIVQVKETPTLTDVLDCAPRVNKLVLLNQEEEGISELQVSKWKWPSGQV